MGSIPVHLNIVITLIRGKNAKPCIIKKSFKQIQYNDIYV